MRILLVCPMPPSRTAPGAIPPLLHAAVTGLRRTNDVTVVCVAGPDPVEISAVAALRAEGVEVHAATREAGGAARRARRAARWGWDWGIRRLPWRTVWFTDPELQRILVRLLRERTFDIVAVEDDGAAGHRSRPASRASSPSTR